MDQRPSLPSLDGEEADLAIANPLAAAARSSSERQTPLDGGSGRRRVGLVVTGSALRSAQIKAVRNLETARMARLASTSSVVRVLDSNRLEPSFLLTVIIALLGGTIFTSGIVQPGTSSCWKLWCCRP